MKITILTLFDKMFDGFLDSSIIKRAIDNKIVSFEIVNFREFSDDKLKRVDDTSFGGGAGMIIRLQPILDCLEKYKTENSKVYLMSASGLPYNQKMAHELAISTNHIILICGHYEGVDSRLLDYIDGEICIGDYILTGGELASMIVADSITRLLDGAISKDSIEEESFENGLLEYPQYTYPKDYKDNKVPEILLTGNHSEIEKWRFKQSVKKTMQNRPDLLDKVQFDKKHQKWFENLNDDRSEKEAIKKLKDKGKL